MTAINEVLRLVEPICTTTDSHFPYVESLGRRGMISLQLRNLTPAISDLEAARHQLAHANQRLLLVDTLTHLALAYAKSGEVAQALANSD